MGGATGTNGSCSRGNVLFFAADRNYAQLAWVAAKEAAEAARGGYDVVLIMERGHDVRGFCTPPGCTVVEADIPPFSGSTMAAALT